MMQFDQVPYIFGSFSRRRHSTADLDHNSNLIPMESNRFISHSYSQSQPVTISFKDNYQSNLENIQRPKSFNFNDNSEYITETEEKSEITMNYNDFYCKCCKKQYVEPKVLPCLHTFCTKCLSKLITANQDQNKIDKIDGQAESNNSNEKQISVLRSDSNCCNDEKLNEASEFNDKTPTRSFKEYNELSSKNNEIICPTCNQIFQLPFDGIKRIPPNFILQNRILLASVNQSSTQLFCDLCTNDISAISRCNYCLINMCQICTEAHKRQRFTWQHEILSLEEAKKIGIKKIRRQIMCINHPDFELKFFCVTCCQVTCRECNKTTHRDHRCDNASSKYAQLYTLKIRQAVERTRPIVQQAPTSLERFHLLRKKIQSRCNAIKNEIETFMDAYIRAVEQHRQMLLLQVDEICVEKIKNIEKQHYDLKIQAKETEDAIKFIDALLQEGTDIEILTFVKPILKKLDYCRQFGNLLEPNISESVQFLPREVASDDNDGCPLYGIITTQKIDPKQCILYNNNKTQFQPKKLIELTLETRDSNKQKLPHGGEKIEAELKYHKELNQKPIYVDIRDCRNGIYSLLFTPEYPGKLILSVKVRGQTIKDNPYVMLVKSNECHKGIFHCCSFCSSNGNREAICGCGSKMPGGYNGCGHGHEGHPGKRHWSCCGNTFEHSECKRITSRLYQISL